MKLQTAILLVIVVTVKGLDNGVARTPPMGFLSWERFRCNTDCKDDPEHCISESLYKRIADEIVAGGYKDVGYEYICVDDCWLAHKRDANGRLQPDPDRFPNGIKALADYIHSKGLKFGIYEDFGTSTCAGYPGSEFFLKTDAETFAEWGVDLLKFDGCNSDPHDMDKGYETMSHFLNKTGRPMVFSCEWPMYKRYSGLPVDYSLIKKYCNFWRVYADIQDSWDSVKSIIQFYSVNGGNFAEVAGPGGFNDPDEVMVGDFGLSYDQSKTHFGMWAMFAAPLLVSADLKDLSPWAKAILQHRGVIAINQDPLGKQATSIYQHGNMYFWKKPLVNDAFAFAFTNFDDQGMPSTVKMQVSQMSGFGAPQKYNITDVFDNKVLGVFGPQDTLTLSVNPTGIFLGKAVPVS